MNIEGSNVSRSISREIDRESTDNGQADAATNNNCFENHKPVKPAATTTTVPITTDQTTTMAATTTTETTTPVTDQSITTAIPTTGV